LSRVHQRRTLCAARASCASDKVANRQ
jgi:hypothetical protein